MSHPGAENQQQSPQDDAALKGKKSGEQRSARGNVGGSAQPYRPPFSPPAALLPVQGAASASQRLGETRRTSSASLPPQPKDDAEQPPFSHSSQLHQFKCQTVNWEPFAAQDFQGCPRSAPSALSAGLRRAENAQPRPPAAKSVANLFNKSDPTAGADHPARSQRGTANVGHFLSG